jgi:hypothetical protein
MKVRERRPSNPSVLSSSGWFPVKRIIKTAALLRN